MDVSDIYLDMCKTATVIQKEHVIQAWDYYYGSKISKFCDSNPRIFVVSDYTTDGGVYGLGIEKSEQEDYELICWLPRQDQLQEIISDKHNILDHKLINMFNLFYFQNPGSNKLNHYVKQFDSMEQLWLALVMKEKYNMTWWWECWAEKQTNEQEN